MRYACAFQIIAANYKQILVVKVFEIEEEFYSKLQHQADGFVAHFTNMD